MGKMSKLSLAVTELRNAAQSLISAADALTDLCSGCGGTQSTSTKEAEVPARAEAPASAKAPAPAEKPLTLEAVRAVLAEKSRSGHTAEVRALLEKRGAAKLSAIDPEEYPALLAEAEGLGSD